jgi:hypothetical protein
MDPLDVTGAAILAAGGWLASASMAGAMSPLRQQIFHQFRLSLRVDGSPCEHLIILKMTYMILFASKTSEQTLDSI